jgi:hypothetical protein
MGIFCSDQEPFFQPPFWMFPGFELNRLDSRDQRLT